MRLWATDFSRGTDGSEGLRGRGWGAGISYAFADEDASVALPMLEEAFGFVRPAVAGEVFGADALGEVFKHDGVPFEVMDAACLRMDTFIAHAVLPAIEGVEAPGEHELAVVAAEDALGDLCLDGELLEERGVIKYGRE